MKILTHCPLCKKELHKDISFLNNYNYCENQIKWKNETTSQYIYEYTQYNIEGYIVDHLTITNDNLQVYINFTGNIMNITTPKTYRGLTLPLIEPDWSNLDKYYSKLKTLLLFS